ncbi:nitrite reductase small subunit NirD [Williamsia sterculiae]|uniref:Nitrite reductase (NADH) small subunit n=1 Tax=Williamsia sterculiae TaxID=1344003 RepID=A0A1N7FYB7_9NOCA|nr:nitrite reductase small subunit NirD [Williamsia sterculiae]SIS05311.1 nitrite reductase (NADH) small subunit [Williamsia sterculiae]
MSVTDDFPAKEPTPAATWTVVCPLDRLLPGLGVAALLPDGGQVAVFRVSAGTDSTSGDRFDRLYAVGNIDPYARAAVMSRGIIGDRAGEPTIASPLLKQVFSLRNGRCLDDDRVALPVHPVRVVDGVVQVGSAVTDAVVDDRGDGARVG